MFRMIGKRKRRKKTNIVEYALDSSEFNSDMLLYLFYRLKNRGQTLRNWSGDIEIVVEGHGAEVGQIHSSVCLHMELLRFLCFLFLSG